MDVNLRVVGIRPPDETWKKMKAVFDACVAARVPVPKEVEQFFNHKTPDALGVVVEHKNLELAGVLKAVGGDMWEGYEIDLSKLPDDVKVLRVANHF